MRDVNYLGSWVSDEDIAMAKANGVDTKQLEPRRCVICENYRNCLNGWCGTCLQEFKDLYGKWPCQTKK